MEVIMPRVVRQVSIGDVDSMWFNSCSVRSRRLAVRRRHLDSWGASESMPCCGGCNDDLLAARRRTRSSGAMVVLSVVWGVDQEVMSILGLMLCCSWCVSAISIIKLSILVIHTYVTDITSHLLIANQQFFVAICLLYRQILVPWNTLCTRQPKKAAGTLDRLLLIAGPVDTSCMQALSQDVSMI